MDDGSRGTGRRLGGKLAICAVAAAVMLGACSAPTLPLPPPSISLISSPDPVSGLVTVSGAVLPDAFVFCLNVRLESGVIVRADAAGRFTLQVQAQIGDGLQVWQEIDADRGPHVDVCVVDCSVRDGGP